MARIIENIKRHVTSVTEQVYDGRRLIYEHEMDVDEYLEAMFETLYDRYVAQTGNRVHMVRDDFLAGRYVGTVSHGNGCKTVYHLHY